jgi:hypothetical protein
MLKVIRKKKRTAAMTRIAAAVAAANQKAKYVVK